MTKLKKLLLKTIAEKEETIVDGYIETLNPQSREVAIYFAGINKGIINTCKGVLKELEALEVSNKQKKKKAANNKFTKPSAEEIKAYCEERKNGVDAENFWDHYEARGWVLNNRQTMKCWKSAVRTWEKKDFAHSKSIAKPTRSEPIPGWLKEQSQENKSPKIQNNRSGSEDAAIARIEVLKKQMSGK